MTMHQLFQMRTVDRTYFSFRMTDISRKLNAKQYFDRTDAKTCRRITSFEEFKEITDHYNYNGEDIEHIRSEAAELLPFYFRNIFRDYREKMGDHQWGGGGAVRGWRSERYELLGKMATTTYCTTRGIDSMFGNN